MNLPTVALVQGGCFGGGTGMPSVLGGLKNNPWLRVNAVVTMFDSGGSSGIAGRAGRRNGFISFISAASMLGIALGVAALIIVLSVMNGFQKEVRDRMLSVVAHVELYDARGAALPDWHALAAKARLNPAVIGAAPFLPAQALVARGDDMRGAMVRGIIPSEEVAVTPLAASMKDTC